MFCDEKVVWLRHVSDPGLDASKLMNPATSNPPKLNDSPLSGTLADISELPRVLLTLSPDTETDAQSCLVVSKDHKVFSGKFGSEA